MVRLLITGLLAVAMAPRLSPGTAAQSPAPAATAQTQAGPNGANSVAPGQPVITIHGVCSPEKALAGATASPCATMVTRQQFEKMIDALNSSNQNLSTNMRRNVAQAYVELLAFGQAAEKAGIENTPQFQEVMRLVRLRTLADVYRRNLEEKYRTPSAGEIAAYYDHNPAKFEEVKLSRIFIPAIDPSGQSQKDNWEKKALATAEEMRERAAKGEDAGALQSAAYAELGLKNPPNTTVGSRRRGMLTPQEALEIFALKPGEVSKVEHELSGYIIYKLDSKQMLAFDQVKDEISRELFRQKMEKATREITTSVHAEFSEAYFGPPYSPEASKPNQSSSPK